MFSRVPVILPKGKGGSVHFCLLRGSAYWGGLPNRRVCLLGGLPTRRGASWKPPGTEIYWWPSVRILLDAFLFVFALIWSFKFVILVK